MKRITHGDVDFDARVAEVIAGATASMGDVSGRVLGIIDEVKNEGDAALIRHIGMFDKWTPDSGSDLMISEDAIEAAYHATDDNLKEALIL